MALSDFTKDITKRVERAGGAYVSDDAGITWYDLGSVKDSNLSWSAVSSDPDSAGRPKMLAADVTGEFMMQQTSDTELGAIDALVAPTGNGLWLKFTTVHTNAAGAGAAAGYTIKNVIPIIEGSLNFMGEESTLSFSIAGRVPISELINLGATQTLTFDA